MELIPIFVAQDSEDGLWSIQLRGESQSEFEKFFDLMNDIEWLHDFFDQNKADLHVGFFGSISIGVAVSIRLTENCYLVTGGAIKLTLDMKRGHLQYELKKLEQAKQFLNNNGIDYPEDLNNYKDE